MDVHRRSLALVLLAACASGEGDSRGEATLSQPPATTGPASTGPDASTDATTIGPLAASTTSAAEPDATTTTGAPTSTSTGEPAGCGDGEVQPPELCDDGDLVDGDGCNVDCTPSGQVLWSATVPGVLGLHDEVTACQVDAAGSIYALGFVGAAMGDDDLWLSKRAATGEELWTAGHAGAAKTRDQGRGLAVDPAELVYAAGFENTATQGNDVFVRKYAADGTAVWTKMYDGPASGGDAAYAATLTPAGELLVVGAQSVAGQSLDAWLRKYSSLGDVMWTRSHAGASAGPDAAYAIAVSAEGHLYVAGSETVEGEADNVWLGKYDADGNQLWSRLYNGAASDKDYLYAALAMDEGGVVVCGFETGAEVPWKSFVRRYDADGLTVWTELDEGPQDAGALCWGLARAAGGDLVLAGAAMIDGQREPQVRRIGPDGTPRWSTVVPGAGGAASHARCVAAAPDGTFVVGGALDAGVDGRDRWLARLSP